MADTHSFPDLLLQMKVCFDQHFFFCGKATAVVSYLELFIYHFTFFSPSWRLRRIFSCKGGTFSRIGNRIGRNFEPCLPTIAIQSLKENLLGK